MSGRDAPVAFGQGRIQMKSVLRVFGIAGLVFCLTGATQVLQAAESFSADLSGGEEVPSISTRARGLLLGNLDDAGTTFTFFLLYFGLEGGGANVAHIHFGSPAVSGGVVAFICGGGGKPACPPDG